MHKASFGIFVSLTLAVLLGLSDGQQNNRQPQRGSNNNPVGIRQTTIDTPALIIGAAGLAALSGTTGFITGFLLGESNQGTRRGPNRRPPNRIRAKRTNHECELLELANEQQVDPSYCQAILIQLCCLPEQQPIRRIDQQGWKLAIESRNAVEENMVNASKFCARFHHLCHKLFPTAVDPRRAIHHEEAKQTV